MGVSTLVFLTLLLGGAKETFRLWSTLRTKNEGVDTRLHLHHEYTARSLAYASTLKLLSSSVVVLFSLNTDIINYTLVCQIEGFISEFAHFLIIYSLIDLCVYDEDAMTSHFSAAVRLVPCWSAAFLWSVLVILDFGFYWPTANNSFCYVRWETPHVVERIMLIAQCVFVMVPIYYALQAYKRYLEQESRLTSSEIHWMPKLRLFDCLFLFIILWSPLKLLSLAKLFGSKVNDSTFLLTYMVAMTSYIVTPRKIANALIEGAKVKKESHRA